MPGILSRIINGRFPRGFSFWDEPNGMNDNLRVIDDHIYIPANLVQTSAAALPPGATAGYTVITTDTGEMAVWLDGAWTRYPAAMGKVAVNGDDLWFNTGSSWLSLDAKIAAALQSFDPAALATFCAAVQGCPVGTRLVDCNGAVLAEGSSVPTCAQATDIATAAASQATAAGIAVGDGAPTDAPAAGKLPFYLDVSATPRQLYYYQPNQIGTGGAWQIVGDGDTSGIGALFEVATTTDLSGTGKPGDPLSVNFPTPPPPGISSVTIAPSASALQGNGTAASPLSVDLAAVCAWLTNNCTAVSNAMLPELSLACQYLPNSANRRVFVDVTSPTAATFSLQKWNGSAWVGFDVGGTSTITTGFTGTAPAGAQASAQVDGFVAIATASAGYYRLEAQTAGVSNSTPFYWVPECPEPVDPGGGEGGSPGGP